MITCKYCGVMTNDNEHEKTCHSIPHVCETCKWCWWQDDTFDSCDNKKSPVDWINRNKHKGFGCNFWGAK